VISHLQLLHDALTIARLKSLTVYDGLFLVLARKHQATLITADQTLAGAL
jgi:predicted nucleic acid-binding protein